MPLYTPLRAQSPNYDPAPNALVVCAGTVSCKNVSSMGAGFYVFKSIFTDKKWHAKLNQLLTNYRDGQSMPAYVPAHKDGAAKGNLLGGIATVPIYNGSDLHPEDGKDQEAQYKEAVTQAILDAQANHRPLYIQPLGTGVYGWPVDEAARLFMAAIQEQDPEGKLEITIPIYSTSSKSNDMKFKQKLETLYGQVYGLDKINPAPQPSKPVSVAPTSGVVSLQDYIDSETNPYLQEAAGNIMFAHDNTSSIKVLTEKVDLATLPPGYYMRFIPIKGSFHLYGIEINSRGDILIQENINRSALARHADSLYADDIRRLDKSGQVVFRTATQAGGGLELHADLARQYCETGSVGKDYYNRQLSGKPSRNQKPTTTKTVSHEVRSTESQAVSKDAERINSLLDKLKLNPNKNEHLQYWQSKVSFVGGTKYKNHTVPHTIQKLMSALESHQTMQYQDVVDTINRIRHQTSNSVSSKLGLSGFFRSTEVSLLRDIDNIEECTIGASFKL